jgi:hypothetical protein
VRLYTVMYTVTHSIRGQFTVCALVVRLSRALMTESLNSATISYTLGKTLISQASVVFSAYSTGFGRKTVRLSVLGFAKIKFINTNSPVDNVFISFDSMHKLAITALPYKDTAIIAACYYMISTKKCSLLNVCCYISSPYVPLQQC